MVNICLKSWFIGAVIGFLLGGFSTDSIYSKNEINRYNEEITQLKTDVYNMMVERENFIKELLGFEASENNQ